MSKKELTNLRQRVNEIAGSIKEQEAFTVQIQDYLNKRYAKQRILYSKTSTGHYAR